MQTAQDVKAAFTKALDQTTSNFGEQARTEIRHLILQICGEVNPYIAVTYSGCSELSTQIFTNATRRDFVFNLFFNFCARLSFTDIETEITDIVNTLCFSLSMADSVIAPGVQKNNLVQRVVLPDEMLLRLPKREEIETILFSNKWLITVLLINLYINVMDFEKLEGQS